MAIVWWYSVWINGITLNYGLFMTCMLAYISLALSMTFMFSYITIYDFLWFSCFFLYNGQAGTLSRTYFPISLYTTLPKQSNLSLIWPLQSEYKNKLSTKLWRNFDNDGFTSFNGLTSFTGLIWLLQSEYKNKLSTKLWRNFDNDGFTSFNGLRFY